MSFFCLEGAGQLDWGPLWTAQPAWPLTITVICCDLRPRFLDKGQMGSGCRAVAVGGGCVLALVTQARLLIGSVDRVGMAQPGLGAETKNLTHCSMQFGAFVPVSAMPNENRGGIIVTISLVVALAPGPYLLRRA